MNNLIQRNRQIYFEQTVPLRGDMLIIAGLLAASGLSETYLVYEDHGKISIGMGVAAMLTVDTDKTSLQSDGYSYTWLNRSLPDSIESALESIPIRHWRAYGAANFELSRYNYGLAVLPAHNPLLQLFIPTFEIRLQDNFALLRALGEDNGKQLLELFNSINIPANTQNSCPFYARIESQRLEVPELDIYNEGVYKTRVNSAVSEIRDQRYQKVILSRKIQLSKELDIVATYVAGRRANTPARSFLLNIDNLKAAGFSPETVVEVTENGWVSTQPLAGTRFLGDDAEYAAQLRKELLQDSKEIYEHAVSVHLAFQELLSVCTPESVCVSDFMSVSRRNTVQHLASRVEGQLLGGYNAWKAFAALFPAVTATGVPKRESIEAIGRLEPEPRNLYSGSVMVTDSSGALDAALVLRTVFQRGDKAWLQVGAGIVDMSNAEREMEETCEKVRSVSENLVHS